jgi:pilus assembly protein CpaC
VLIQVQVMKVSRTRLEQLGYDLSEGGVAGLLNRDGKAPVDADAGKAKATPKAAGPKPLDSATISPGDRCKAVIAAWKKEGVVVEVVAEPTIATVSGRPAFMRVGGEFPFLVPVPGGRMKTEMRAFGTQLDALPLLLDDGRVRLELRPRVSEIDETRSVTVNGVTTPGLRVREIDTGVELQPGETFAVSGYGQWVKAKAKPDSGLEEAPAEHVELLVLAKVELVDAMVPVEGGDAASGHDETPHAD